MLKWISILVLGVAVITAALSGVHVMNTREAIARHNKEAAESAEEAAKQAARKADSEAKAALANENAERAKAQAKQDELKISEANLAAKLAEEEKAKHDAKIARDNRADREAAAKKAEEDRLAEKDKADAAQAKAEEARAIADAKNAEARAEADKKERERLAAQAVADEARLWELKAIDLAALEKDLNDYKKELDARELALRPEKTIKDLANIATTENAAKDDGALLLPENDPTLPKADRILARRQRIVQEEADALLSKARNMTVSRLEKLYVAAIRANRITDAEYYRKTLLSLYPDWEFTPQKNDDDAIANEQ